MVYASFDTMPERKLHSMKQTNKISDDIFVSVLVRGCTSILYVLPSPIIRSI